jgi:hypothetical protein
MKIGTGVQAILCFVSEIWEAVMLVLLMGRIHEVRRWDELGSHDIYTKFHKDWFRHSKVVKLLEGYTHRQLRWSHKPNLVFQNTESRQKILFRTHKKECIKTYKYKPTYIRWPVTVAARSMSWTVFTRSDAGIVGSNPNQGMDLWYMYAFIFCLCCPVFWPRDTLYPLKLALTSPTSGGRSVSIVRLRTQATELSCV